jgi:phosphate transport system protein
VPDEVDASLLQLFALVGEALARATWALLNSDRQLAESVVQGDRQVDDQVAAVEQLVWARLDAGGHEVAARRHLVGTLLILPELERSADLAEHVAQRALVDVGSDMTPVSRGIVQRMSEVAIEMWRAVADAYADAVPRSVEIDEADEELDILHDRLTAEVATGAMEPSIASQVTLLARFYERIGDHAVNLSRRIAGFYA